MYNSGSNNLGLLLYYCKKIISWDRRCLRQVTHKIIPEYFNEISDNNLILLMLTDSINLSVSK